MEPPPPPPLPRDEKPSSTRSSPGASPQQHRRRRSGRFGLEMYRSLSEDTFDLFTAESEASLPYLDNDEADFSESDTTVDRKRSRASSIRHRYDVVGELGCEEVRWFYKEDRKTWKPFIGYDSLRIELMYRDYLKLAARDSGLDSVQTVCVRGGLYEVNVIDKGCYPVYWYQPDKIVVMRGQWFVDGTWQPLEEEDSNLIEAEHLKRFRGQQMQDAFELDVAKPMDSKDVFYQFPPFYLPFLFKWRRFKESTDTACNKRKYCQAIHSLKLRRNHVDWYSVDEVYLYSDATTSKIARTVTQKLGFSKASSSGTRLHRGYVEESSLEDKPPLPTHIVFVVHGIGQKMDQGRIIKNTGMMREAARKVEEKHFPYATNLEYVEFLPVEWRSKLCLDGDTVESITPDKVRGLRDMLNSSAMDIMYYTSPLYRDEIVKGLQQELNRLYALFCSRNPDFEIQGGKVSIVAHSLGCVITYDIMTGWYPVRFYDKMVQEEEEMTENSMSFEERELLDEILKTKERLKKLEHQLLQVKASEPFRLPALKFKVENFFCMGSPLAVFLALRGIRPQHTGNQDHILPKSICGRLYNIFHPTDPVAYRLEPLILKHYSNIAPLQIHWYNTPVLTKYDDIRPTYIKPAKESMSPSMPPSATTSHTEIENMPSPSSSPVIPRRNYGESITSLGKASIMGAAHIGKGIGGILFARFTRSSSISEEYKDEPVVEDRRTTEAHYSPRLLSRNNSGLLYGTVELEHRLDFELREGLVESRYWSAVTSHTSYWSSLDVALFLLSFLYTQRPPVGVDQSEDTRFPGESPHK
ncbi:phospholipase DDHD1b isoform X1 [Hemiscyllium ocellatum]|uniref:phospholipase DDHD1b isoform X1 n=1 Tax=Hemiscyllium ocellatum TaxID=170820 RepID=UPI002966586A|nr:phospholipase DDHD1b isoform X1 [Hemiscyllium ocellatum]